MTVRNFINKRIRPCIGDTLHSEDCNPQPHPPLKQMAKYPEEVLLDHLNEGVLDIARNSDLFIDTAYLLIRANQTELSVPDDYLGFYNTNQFSAGNTGYNFDSTLPELQIAPTRTGLRLIKPIDNAFISRYSKTLEGVDLPADVIDKLIQTNQIEPPPIPLMARDLLTDAILVSYEYKRLPKEYLPDDEISDRELMYLLKWFTASHALYGDLHNEAVNLAQVYEVKYQQRLKQAGQTETNWNSVSLTPWSYNYSHYI